MSSSDGFWDVDWYVGISQCPLRCPQFASKGGCGLVARPYDDTDRDILAETYCDYDPDAQSMGLPPADEAHITEWSLNFVGRGHNFTAVVSRGIVGHAAYMASDDPEPEPVVFVRQDSHDRGIGTELYRHVIADAANAGRRALILHTAPDNQRAAHAHRELGFETVGSDGVNMKMRFDLTPPVPLAARPTAGTESRE